MLATILNRRSTPRILLFAMVLFALYTGFLGIDYGPHWDEGYVFQQAEKSFRNGLFLPRRYNYPSVSYDITVIGAVPYVLVNAGQEMQQGMRADLAVQESLGVLTTKDFLLYTRTIFLVISVGLSCLWTFLLIEGWDGNPWEALLGAAILGLSWEPAYHSRWVAPDALLMQFGILSMWLVLTGMNSNPDRRFNWLALAALSSALACGSKYFGGIFLLPILAAALFAEGKAEFRKNAPQLLALILIFCAAFVLSTPGALVEPFSFVKDIRREITHYGTGHYGNTVSPGFQHGYLLVEYLALAGLSRFPAVALVFFGCALMGAYVLLVQKEHRFKTYVFLLVPVGYGLYMISQRVMIARNYLLLFPFLAVLSARGIVYILQQLRPYPVKIAATVLLLSFIVANSLWLAGSARSIVQSDNINPGERLLTYMNAHPGEQYCLSGYVEGFYSGEALPASVVSNPGIDTNCQYVLSTAEVPLIKENGGKWVANRLGRYQVVAGPQNLNFDYYPWWPGDPKIISIRYSEARAAGLVNVANP